MYYGGGFYYLFRGVEMAFDNDDADDDYDDDDDDADDEDGDDDDDDDADDDEDDDDDDDDAADDDDGDEIQRCVLINSNQRSVSRNRCSCNQRVSCATASSGAVNVNRNISGVCAIDVCNLDHVNLKHLAT